MNRQKKYIFFIILSVCFVIDIASKHFVFKYFSCVISDSRPENMREIYQGVFVPPHYRPLEIMTSPFTFTLSVEDRKYFDETQWIQGNEFENLQGTFAHHGYPLSQYTTLIIEDREDKWTLNDRGNGRRYFIEKKSDSLIVTPSFFSFCVALNRGAVWGVMQKKTILLTLITLGAIGFIMFLVFKKDETGRIAVPLGLIMAGALGNLWDRLLFNGVRDFIDFHLGFMRWPTFNPADIFIVVGVAIYFILEFSLQFKKEKSVDENG